MRIAIVVCSLIFVLISAHRRGHLSKDRKDKLARDWKIGDLDKWKERLDKMRVNMKDMSESEKAELRRKIKSIRKVKHSEEANATGPLEVNEETGVAEYLYQGDILLTPEQLRMMEASKRTKRQTSGVAARWPNSTLSYYFEDNFYAMARDDVRRAVKLVAGYTCVVFEEDDGQIENKHQVKVYHGEGCNSHIGKIRYMNGFTQPLSLLLDGCLSSGTIIHEFMHALGIHHMQARPDRDEHVNVDFEKVNKTYAHNYNIESGVNSTVPYELGSIMHYTADSFSTPVNVVAMIPHDINYLYTMGSELVSFNDYKMINDMYNCHDLCPPISSAKCQNGGYPHPRNCAICNCPTGFSGPLCDQKPSQCGQAFEATSQWQTANVSSENGTVLDQPEYKHCVYWIKAPEGSEVEIKIKWLSVHNCVYGCKRNGIEIKSKIDQTTGIRYCCSEFAGSSITSQLNPTPIIAYSDHYLTKMTFEYRFVPSVPMIPCKKSSPIKRVWLVSAKMHTKFCNQLFFHVSGHCYLDTCGPVKYDLLPLNYSCNLHWDHEFSDALWNASNYIQAAQLIRTFENNGTNATIPQAAYQNILRRSSSNVIQTTQMLEAWELDGILYNCTVNRKPMACQLFDDVKTRRGILQAKKFDGVNLGHYFDQ